MGFPRSRLSQRGKESPGLPQNLSDLPWNNVRGPLHRYLLWLDEQSTGVPGGFKDVDPSTITPDATADPGDENQSWAAADHTHAIQTDQASGLANANAEGTSTSSFSRSDHQHKRDVRVALNGSDVGTRNRLNFIAPTGTVTDDAGNDEVDINLTAVADDAKKLAVYAAWVL